jgi:hypothetical protein
LKAANNCYLMDKIVTLLLFCRPGDKVLGAVLQQHQAEAKAATGAAARAAG